jgi:alanine-glyoxylate transaminase / (R)-3-amino-2-methylpropionate-pyruvate transaminase
MRTTGDQHHLTGAEITRLHREYLFPCVSTYYREPLPLVGGEGMYLTDADGREYLDFFAGILTVSVGHCNPEVTQAVAEQSRTLQHTSTLYPTAPLGLLARRLAELTPPGLSKSFFTSSGSEANETAILLARVATGRDEVIALRHAYAGRTEAAVNTTGQAPWRPTSTTLPFFKHAHNAYCYRCSFGLTYPACDLRCARDIEELIQTTTSGAPAAFMAEPIQGVGGFVTPPPEYFSVVVDIMKRYGALFICDEVQTAWGRTGGHWFGIEHWGVKPDIMTFAKGMGNGAPLSATIARREIADSFRGLSIATFGGNPVSCTAGLATIDYIESHGLVENARLQGDRLRQGLEGLREKHPVIGDVRGMGLMQGLELIMPDGKEPNPEAVLELFELTREEGLLIGKGGLYGNVIRLAPPLVVTADEVDVALQLLDRAFDRLGRSRQPNGGRF